MDEKGLGKRLQQARQQAGLTQQQLCQHANISFSTLTKIERGAIKAPSIFTVQAIAEATGTGLNELVGAPSARRHRTLHRTKSGASFIYFDVNECLVHYSQRLFMEIAADTGQTADVVETAFWRYDDSVCRGVMSLDDFNRELARDLKVDHIEWQAYYLKNTEPITPIQELITRATEHYKVGLISNTMPTLLSAMRQNGTLPDLPYDAIIDSSEVGAIKPERKIYEAAQAQAGYPSEEILFIDDSKVNLMAAGKLGWRVLWFDGTRPEESAETIRQALEAA